MEKTYSIFPLGDSAITIDLGDRIDVELNRKAMAIRDLLIARRIAGVKDIIVAYSSVSVLYDPVSVRAGEDGCRENAYGCLKAKLEQVWEQSEVPAAEEGKAVIVPVCYGGRYGPDLEKVAATKKITPAEVIQMHSSRIYHVYMVGFLPGFAYLGKVDERLDMPRKAAPVPVVAGSVGIVGNQSGIYPLNSPGGWHILGLTPLKLFDPQAELPIRLKTGDKVQFFPISVAEFEELSRQSHALALAW